MLGRMVGQALRSRRPATVWTPELLGVFDEADVAIVNLECCISERGEPWEPGRKPFHFRAPPRALEALTAAGIRAVWLANNHALDFGPIALLDTFEHLRAGGIGWVGAGADVDEARTPRVVDANGLRLGIVAFSDHPPEYAADRARPGIAFSDLWRASPAEWIGTTVGGLDVDAVLVTPHWGPNMTAKPVAHVAAAARDLVAAGATLIAGHSAHVFHGVGGTVLYDVGDFLDDYAVDARLRNDLGLLFLVDLDERGPVRLEGVPLKLDYCHTRLADGVDRAWIARRFHEACAELGTAVSGDEERLVVSWR